MSDQRFDELCEIHDFLSGLNVDWPVTIKAFVDYENEREKANQPVKEKLAKCKLAEEEYFAVRNKRMDAPYKDKTEAQIMAEEQMENEAYALFVNAQKEHEEAVEAIKPTSNEINVREFVRLAVYHDHLFEEVNDPELLNTKSITAYGTNQHKALSANITE